MRAKIDLFCLLILSTISFFLLFGLFTNGVYSSHDGEVHIGRMAQFYQAVFDGQFPPRWLSGWNFGFGYPAFVYVYSLPYWFGLVLKLVGLSFEQVFKSLVFLSLFLSGVSFYYFAKNIMSKIAALVGAIFYIAAPYRFADIYERGALAESLAFVLMPLLFLAPFIFVRDKSRGFLFLSLTIFASITTHALVLGVFLVPFLIFSLYMFKNEAKKYLPIFLVSIIFGLLLSAYQWIPMVLEQKYIELNKTYFNLFSGHFITINQLLRIPKEGINIGTGIQLGGAQIIILIITFGVITFKILRRKSLNASVLLFLFFSIAAAFLMLNYSLKFWEIVKPLQSFLFPWRFLTMTTFACAVLAGYLVEANSRFKLLTVIALIFLAIFPSRHYLAGHGWHSFSDDYYYNFGDPLKLDNYFLPSSSYQLDKLQLEPVSIIEGQGAVKLIRKQSNLVAVFADLEKDSKIQLRTLNFPGWEVYVDGRGTKIIDNYPNLEGVIVTGVSGGAHLVTLKFVETEVRQLANIISLLSFFFLAIIWGWPKKLRPFLGVMGFSF